MLDLIMLAILLASFALVWAYASLCARVLATGPDQSNGDASP
jgi:hypothetical protein